MAAPSPAQTPGAPIRPGAFAFLKRLPTPVWLVAGGAGIGLVYTLVMRQRAAATDGTDLAETGDGTIPDDQLAGAASPVAYVTTAAPASEPAETVGAVGQTALETMGGLLTSLIESGRPLAGAAPIIPTDVAPPPPPIERPVPAPVKQCPVLPAGYTHGSSVYGKSFPSAVGWTRIGSGGTGKDHWVDIHVRYPTRLQRWRFYPNRKPPSWSKTFEDNRPNLPTRPC